MADRVVTEFDLRAPEFKHPDTKPEDYEFRADGKVVRKDRWETGLRNVASALGWARKEYEIPEIVEHVRMLAEPRFQWVCARGCVECEVKRIEFAYETVEDMAGNELSRKTVPRLVSKCCGAPLTMWDNFRDEQIDVDLDPFPDSNGVPVASSGEIVTSSVTRAEDGHVVAAKKGDVND